LQSPSFVSNEYDGVFPTPFYRDVHVKNQPKRIVLNKGISVHFSLKTHVPRMCLSFRQLRWQFWMEGGGLQIFETFWGAIEAIKTLIPGLQIGVNIRGVNCSFPKNLFKLAV
jgi:hypothetical protein